MAINYELLNSGAMTVGGGFNLYSKNPLDSRLVIPGFDGLQTLIDNGAAYEGMIAYISSEKKHYEVKTIDGVLSYRQFGLTNDELNELITNATTAAMEFKGVTATLPENPAKGDMYKVSGETIDITIDGVAAQAGDSIVYNGEEWFLIPSGDDIEDTWRPVAGVANDATLTFEAGDKLDVAVASTGNVKYSHEAIVAPANTNAEGDTKVREYITSLETDGFGHITGYKTNTEVVEDTNSTYEFECAAEHSNVYFTVKEKLNGEEVAEHTVCVDAYNKNETDDKIKGAIEALDVTDISGFGAGKTLATLTETDGKIAATFQDIAITESQITDLGDYKTIQQVVEAVETDTNEFIDTVAQDENGVVTITTKSVDFSQVYEQIDSTNENIDKKLDAGDWTNENSVLSLDQGAGESIKIKASSITFAGEDIDMEENTGYSYSTVYGDRTISHTPRKINNEGDTFTYNFPNASGTFALTSDVEAVSDRVDSLETDTHTHDNKGVLDDITAAKVTSWDGKLDANGWTIDENGKLNLSGYFDPEAEEYNSHTTIATGQIELADDLSDGVMTLSSYGVQLKNFGTLLTTAYTEADIKRTLDDGSRVTIDLPAANGTIALTSDIEAAVNAIDTGVTKVTAGNDIVVTPEAGTGEVTVSHAVYGTGEYTAPEVVDDTKFVTGINVKNGHVIGAQVKSLADALAAMTFIFDGGTSAN